MKTITKLTHLISNVLRCHIYFLGYSSFLPSSFSYILEAILDKNSIIDSLLRLI